MLDTQRIMKNYGIRFQKRGHLYKSYVAVRASTPIWEALKMAEDLYVQLINTDQNFDSYTKTSLPKKGGTLAYVTNSEVLNRFNEDTSVSPSIIKSRALRFNVNVSATEAMSVVIKNNQGEVIFNKMSLQKQHTIAVDISVFGTGIYQLWIDNVLSSTFLGTSERVHPNCYGILHIQMQNILESLKENTTPSLNVSFEARATFREYLIIVAHDKKIDIQDMTIESEDNGDYLGPEKRIVMGNKEANVFASTKAIKLCQKPTNHSILKIQYTNHFSDTLLELDIKMPVPAVSSIITKKNNNANVFYSQTIIYV